VSAQVEALIAIAACRKLVAVVSEACSGDVAQMLAALTGAIVVLSAGYGEHQDDVLQSAVAGIEQARGTLASKVRAAVLSGGTPS